MTELETLKRARMYLATMAEGKNPLTGEEEPDSSILNQARIVRCLYYVTGILDKVIENGGEINQRPPEKVRKIKRTEPFSLTDEQLCDLTAEPKAISFSALLQKINAPIPPEMKKLSYDQMASWLIAQGLMEEHRSEQGKLSRRPTEAGNAAGITREQMFGQNGPYWGNLLTTDAQIFLLSHLQEIAAFDKEQALGIDPETGEVLE